jgi:3-carboxy-cis,cis-muconate cycloisomerase
MADTVSTSTSKANAKRSSLTSSSGLFGELFLSEAVRAATSDRAWVQAMLDFEAALAAAEAEAGLIPSHAAEAIAAACQAGRFDAAALGREGKATANPAAPLVSALTDAVEGDAAGYVHWGATSQDVMDTAAMLVARRALKVIDEELAAVAAACAVLADEHRETLMVARTLMQQALPTSFGFKVAGWLSAVVAARARLTAIPLTVELGGAAGTLASLGSEGTRVLAALADGLGLEEPLLPWHTARGGIAELGAALALAAGALGKVALDVKLLAQTEVGEVAESGGEGRGASSTLPHKRNPVGSALALACAGRVRGEASILLEAMVQEHERAAGAWQAEWPALSDALAYAGGAAAAMREVLEGLDVRPQRMRQNLDSTGGLVMTEAVSMAVADRIGRGEARRLVGDAVHRAAESGRSLREEIGEDPLLGDLLSTAEIDAVLDPARYLGSAEAFVDRALAAWKEHG